MVDGVENEGSYQLLELNRPLDVVLDSNVNYLGFLNGAGEEQCSAR